MKNAKQCMNMRMGNASFGMTERWQLADQSDLRAARAGPPGFARRAERGGYLPWARCPSETEFEHSNNSRGSRVQGSQLGEPVAADPGQRRATASHNKCR